MQLTECYWWCAVCNCSHPPVAACNKTLLCECNNVSCTIDGLTMDGTQLFARPLPPPAPPMSSTQPMQVKWLMIMFGLFALCGVAIISLKMKKWRRTRN